MTVKVLCFPFHSALSHNNVQINLNTDTEPRPFHLWRYIPFWALASLTRRHHSSRVFFSSLSILLFLGPRMCPSRRRPLILFLVSPLVFITKFSIKTLSSSIFATWPAYPILLILISSKMFRILYKL